MMNRSRTPESASGARSRSSSAAGWTLIALFAISAMMAIGSGFLDPSGTANWSALSATVTKPEPKKEPKKRPCCRIGIAYLTGGSKVTLTQVCNTRSRSIFHFKTQGVASACTHPPGTVLRDQKGRRYKMLAAHGLPECSSGNFSESPNLRFRWEFTKLKSDVKKFTLLEIEDNITEGLAFWAWRDIDVSHCRF
ncbi:MAG: hypothetical protein NXI24_12615 [bacterium]|nr:hypothetical protein [bacterium]